MIKEPSTSLRANKFLAQNMGISRREADELILSSQVCVNDRVIKLGDRLDNTDIIKVKGKVIAAKKKLRYIMLNKPIGYVCSRKQQGKSPTIFDLLPKHLHDLKTVGRLDKNSSGLIILTDDGDFAFQMTHPSFYKVKIYKIKLNKELEPLHQQMICDYGIKLEDGPSKLMLERIRNTSRREWIVSMHEGRNRQIRRTFAALGYEVKRLHRTNFGIYSLGDIQTSHHQQVDMRSVI